MFPYSVTVKNMPDLAKGRAYFLEQAGRPQRFYGHLDSEEKYYDPNQKIVYVDCSIFQPNRLFTNAGGYF